VSRITPCSGNLTRKGFMSRLLLVCAAASGFCAVAAGAFGAHALRGRLDAPMLAAYQTGVLYHLIHTVALLAVGVLASIRPHPTLHGVGYGFLAGIGLFSGSLYALSLSGVRLVGAITPVGGLVWLASWAALGLWAVRQG
jgi:uncharacterized membrane protein YgdD (TMEM256/DUF423 family)